MKVTKTNLGRAIQFANSYGLDKKSMKDRMKWAENEGIELAEKIVHKQYFPVEASDPYQTVTAAHEWLYPGMAGVDLVCHVDGSCNGLQHGAANTGHEATAKATNCCAATREDEPEDLYRMAAETTLQFIDRKGKHDLHVALKKQGRKLMKPPVMRTSYGASIKTAVLSLIEELSTKGQERAYAEMDTLKPAVKESLKKHAGAIIEMTQQLRTTISDSEENEITWITQDGFKVIQKARAKKKEDRVYLGGGKHTTRIDGVSEAAQSTGIAPNYVHSQDGAMLRETLRQCDFDMACVHDSYGTRSENWVEMYHRLRRAFVTIHEHDQGSTLTVGGVQHPVKFRKVGNYDPKEVLNAPYFFS